MRFIFGLGSPGRRSLFIHRIGAVRRLFCLMGCAFHSWICVCRRSKYQCAIICGRTIIAPVFRFPFLHICGGRLTLPLVEYFLPVRSLTILLSKCMVLPYSPHSFKSDISHLLFWTIDRWWCAVLQANYTRGLLVPKSSKFFSKFR